MAVTRSGAIKFSNLQTEFGGSHPISLSEYYKGGSLVPNNLSYSNYGTGISGGHVPNVPTSGSISLGSDFYASGEALIYTTQYSGGTSPVKTAWSNPVSASFSVSTYLGSLSSGDTFVVCARNTSGWPSGWTYGGYDTVIIACTYGSSTSLTGAAFGSKQFRPSISYDGSNTVTISGAYRGDSTSFRNGQVALQGIVRTN